MTPDSTSPASEAVDLLERARKVLAKLPAGPFVAADWTQNDGLNRFTVEASKPENLRSGQQSIWPNGIVKIKVAECEEAQDPAFAEAIAEALNTLAELAALTPPPPQPAPTTDAQELQAFGASDGAAFRYPGEDQAAERAAFCEGAASVVPPADARENAVDGERLFRCFMAGDTNRGLSP